MVEFVLVTLIWVNGQVIEPTVMINYGPDLQWCWKKQADLNEYAKLINPESITKHFCNQFIFSDEGNNATISLQ